VASEGRDPGVTITFVAVAAGATGNNTSVAPAAPTGVAVKDLVIIAAAIRNSGAGTVTAPAGWTKVAESGNACLLGRFWQAGDAMPTVTFAGGVANADTFARALAFRGVAPDQIAPDASAVLLNASAQNVGYPALTVPSAGSAVLLFGWKQDDATSVATPAGWTALFTTNQTTGDDQMVSAYYQIQTAAANIAAGSLVVTGGAAAISRGLVAALKPAAAIVATVVDLYPPRVLITVTGLTIGDDVDIYRMVGGSRTLVRAGSAVDVTDPAMVRADGEVPFGVPVTYLAVVNGTAEYATAATTYTLPGGMVALSDAVTGSAAQAVIMSWDEKTYERQSSVFKVGGRNVVVSGDLGMFTATLELYFEAYVSGQNFRDLIDSSTEGVIQLRRPAAQYEGVDCYLSVLTARERRFSQDGSDPRRLWVVDVAETDPWSTELEASVFTWQDVANAYATWDALNLDYATWLAVAQGDFS
jgi:hypothetical protein